MATLPVTYRAPLLMSPSEVDGGEVTFDVAGLGQNLGVDEHGIAGEHLLAAVCLLLRIVVVGLRQLTAAG